MPADTNSTASLHPELQNEIERLRGELQVLEEDLTRHKHISDRAIHYKHETRRRTVQRNILALVVLLLVAWIFYLQITRSVVWEAKAEQVEMPSPHIEALAPVSEDGE